MLNLTDLKPGVAFVGDGVPYLVVSSQHSKLGRGGAILRTKIKNLFTGATIDRTFRGSEGFEEAELEKKKAQFLYQEGADYHFMTSGTFEQFSLSAEKIGADRGFLKEGGAAEVLYYGGQPISIQLPVKMDFKVTYTEPGFRGDTASATLKSATIETGVQVQVPLFIKTGDIIRIDTRSGQYVERV